MIEINKTTLSIAAGIAATTFIGYCIYFDNKRRTDPEYKKKVRERRRRNRQNGANNKGGIPNLNDHEAIERYFLEEIRLGETQIASGQFEEGVEHLANALVVCGQPTRLLQVLQSTLPAQVFAMLILKMQDLANRAGADSNEGPRIVAASSDNTSMEYKGSANDAIMIDDLE